MDITNLALPLTRWAAAANIERAVERVHGLGVTATTFMGAPAPFISGEPALSGFWPDLDAATRAATLALRQRFARAVIHAPFRDVPLVSENPYIEREAHRQLHAAIEAAGALNLEIVTVHAAQPLAGLSQEEHRERIVAALQMLGDAAAQAGTRIGLENWRYPCEPDEHVRILEEVDHPAVGATLDVGHIVYWYQRDGILSLPDPTDQAEYHQRLYRFIDGLGPRIWHVHMHDVRAADLADHRGVGRGFLNIEGIIERLARQRFDGVILFEIAEPDFQAAAQSSVKRLVEAMHALDESPVHPTAAANTLPDGSENRA